MPGEIAPVKKWTVAMSRVVEDLRIGPGGPMTVAPIVVYAGRESLRRTSARQLSWRDIHSVDWTGVSAARSTGHRPRRDV